MTKGYVDIQPIPPGSSFLSLTNPKYTCPRHGQVEQAIISTIDGLCGHWCTSCFLEALDRLGVHRAEPIT